MASHSIDIEYDLLKKHINNPVSHLVLSEDKEKFHAPGGFIAYSRIQNLAVVLGEPICSMEKKGSILKHFENFCDEENLRPIFFCTKQDTEGIFAHYGKYHIGDDSIITIPLSGCDKIKRASRSANRRGIEVFELERSQWHLLRGIDEEWISEKNTDFIHFIVNNNLDSRNCRVFAAKKGPEILGYISVYCIDEHIAYLDIIRTRKKSPNGASELLISKVCEILGDCGVMEISFGFVPGINSNGHRGSHFNLLLDLLYVHGNTLYPAKNQFRFKSKFNPRWEPRFAYCSKKVWIADLYLIFLLFHPTGFSGLWKKWRK